MYVAAEKGKMAHLVFGHKSKSVPDVNAFIDRGKVNNGMEGNIHI